MTDDPLSRMKALAASESDAVARIGSDSPLGDPITRIGKFQIIRRAQALCASCERYVPKDAKRYQKEVCCGQQSCKDKIDRWKRFARPDK